MSLFVEVDDIDKGCKVIINMDLVAEIAPLSAGGCAIFFADSSGSGAKSSMRVKDSFTQFQQFVMKTITSEDIAARVAQATGAPAKVKLPKGAKIVDDLEIPKL